MRNDRRAHSTVEHAATLGATPYDPPDYDLEEFEQRSVTESDLMLPSASVCLSESKLWEFETEGVAVEGQQELKLAVYDLAKEAETEQLGRSKTVLELSFVPDVLRCEDERLKVAWQSTTTSSTATFDSDLGLEERLDTPLSESPETSVRDSTIRHDGAVVYLALTADEDPTSATRTGDIRARLPASESSRVLLEDVALTTQIYLTASGDRALLLQSPTEWSTAEVP